ncbi:hypothetical protein V2S66_32955 [Streptomyces sp. V4-01]|uniref:Uncharacterized protein n=1 Tax=Actinacidiphila polyblastidii TaxID=3110430 RepID=A0ABU7PM36_9ACTN|nr:hypothetical protein [Streptomyces sp. V4-01]
MTGQQALSRLAKGTGIILRGLATAGEWRETLARWFIAALVGSLAACAVALHPWLAPAAGLAWLAAANAAAGPADEDDQEDDEPEDEEEEPLDLAAFAELVHDVAGGRNVHLVELRRQLALETDREWTAADVTALCEAAGIRIRKGVRVPGATPAVTTGIHHTDLPPVHSPASDPTPVGVVAAGQRSNNNTNITQEHIGEGGWITRHGPAIHQEARR